jgi:exopolysaccharide production protein ExoQ
MIDKYVILPTLVVVYVTIASPLLEFVTRVSYKGADGRQLLENLMEQNPANRYFWPMLAAISVTFAMLNWSRLVKHTWSPHLICLFSYLALAGASVLWAFKPEYALIRFVSQLMIIVSIVVPTILAARSADLMRCLFLCFAFASIMNIPFVLNEEPNFNAGKSIGYPGFFSFKGVLGECATITLLLAFHEMFYPGLRRTFAGVVIVVAIWLTFESQSKGALGFAIISPLAAALALAVAWKMRISVATILSCIIVCYIIFSTISGFSMNKLSWYLYSNYTFSGRTVIWDFAKYEIARRPLLGWGYQSFWLVGPDAPSVVDAPGWVKTMPSAHSGYLDVQLELGYVGFALLLGFIFTTLRAIGRVADRDRTRAWLMLTLALYVMLTNVIETTWVRGGETLWVIFVIVAAEAGRYWHSLPSAGRLHYVVGQAVRQKRGVDAASKMRAPRSSTS